MTVLPGEAEIGPAFAPCENRQEVKRLAGE